MRPLTRTLRRPISTVLPAVVTLALIAGPLPLGAQAVLSEFEGSTPLGSYESNYDRLSYATSLANDGPVEGVEGKLISRAFQKPDGRSNLEVFRSYQNELERGGFGSTLPRSSTPRGAFA